MTKKNILLVEDDFLNRRLTKKVLLEGGFSIFEAKNAEIALEVLKNETIDLAILDINLGDEVPDGIGLGKAILENFKIPFIFLTAYETSEIINKAIETLPSSFLTKPFKTADLLASIEIALANTSVKENIPQMIWVKDGKFKKELALNEINFIQSEGNYLLIFTTDSTFKIRSTLSQILEQLPGNNFVRIHRAYVVNSNKIEKYSSKSVIINNREIPISKNEYTLPK